MENELCIKKKLVLPNTSHLCSVDPNSGSIVYNSADEKLYYSSGVKWFSINSSSFVLLFISVLKNGDLVIPPNTATKISNWEKTSLPILINEINFSLITGEYIALNKEIINLTIMISWSSGINNRGTRILRVIHQRHTSFSVIQEVKCQANPSYTIETSQSINIVASLKTSDKLYFEVFHDSDTALKIASGSITGFVSRNE